MQIGFKQIFFNYFVKAWGLISIYLFVPLYVKYLGIESYGVVSIYALLLGLISFIDSGLSATIIKEFSEFSDRNFKYSLLKIIEGYYLKISILLVLSLMLLSPLFVEKWLNANYINTDEMIFIFRLIVIGVILQLFSSIYYGALFGLNNQIEANSANFIWNLIKPVGIVLFFYFYDASLTAFFVWTIFCNLTYLLFLRFLTYKKLSGELPLKKEFKILPKRIQQFLLSMVFIALISSINSQIDKLLISSIFSIKEFGFYSIASTLSQLPVLICVPFVATFFPLLVKFKDSVDAWKIYYKMSVVLTSTALVLATVLIVFTDQILELWLGEQFFSNGNNDLVKITRLLTIGSLFLALQILPFNFLVSKGLTKYTLRQGFLQILIGIPLLLWMTNRLGLIGAGIPWIIINVGAYIYLNFIIFKYYYKEHFSIFFKNTLGLPLAVITIIILLYFSIRNYINLHFSVFCFLIFLIFFYLVIVILNKNNKVGFSTFTNFFKIQDDE